MKNNAQTAFVESVFRRKKEDKAFRARMRAAGSPSREHEVWGDLTYFIDIEDEDKREAYVLIGESIALDKTEQPGELTLGQALLLAWSDEKNYKLDDKKKMGQHPAVMRLNRLVSCRDAAEACRVLRPMLKLIRSRVAGVLDYALLLSQLLAFRYRPEAVKARWVKEFYAALSKRKGAQGE